MMPFLSPARWVERVRRCGAMGRARRGGKHDGGIPRPSQPRLPGCDGCISVGDPSSAPIEKKVSWSFSKVGVSGGWEVQIRYRPGALPAPTVTRARSARALSGRLRVSGPANRGPLRTPSLKSPVDPLGVPGCCPGPGRTAALPAVTAGGPGAAGPKPEPGGSRPRACRRAGDLALSGDAGSPGLRLGLGRSGSPPGRARGRVPQAAAFRLGANAHRCQSRWRRLTEAASV
jgi:hypothetical protein